MKRVFLYVILLTVIILQFFGCGATHENTESSNSSLVVTYNGKEVHRRNTGWINQQKLEQISNEDKQKVIIFGAPWCKSCSVLRKAITQANVGVKVYYVNIDEPWVTKLASILGIKQVPTMIHIAKNGDIVNYKVGPGKITMYLLLTF